MTLNITLSVTVPKGEAGMTVALLNRALSDVVSGVDDLIDASVSVYRNDEDITAEAGREIPMQEGTGELGFIHPAGPET